MSEMDPAAAINLLNLFPALTFLATWGSETQEKVISEAAMTSEGVMASLAPTATKSPHCKENEEVKGEKRYENALKSLMAKPSHPQTAFQSPTVRILIIGQ